MDPILPFVGPGVAAARGLWGLLGYVRSIAGADMVFVPFPVNGDAEILFGQEVGKPNPDARYWRWVASARSGTIVGSAQPPDLQVEFVVVGYRARALVAHFTGK